jgi:hypothetical protein
MDRSRQRLKSLGLLAIVLVVVGAGTFAAWPGSTPTTVVASPAAFEPAWWVSAVGVDTPITQAELNDLNTEANSDLAGPYYATLKTLGEKAAVATVEGTGRSSFGTYFKDSAPALCHGVRILAVSPVVLPVAQTAGTNTTNWAKILVAYEGACSGSPLGASDVQVMFLYAHLTLSWHLTHEYQIPGSQDSDPAANDSPASWQMTHFSSCTGSGGVSQEDLIVVVDAFDEMCQAASAAGVSLQVTAGWRSAAQQAALFQEAVKAYGSVAKAKQYVAYATPTSCTSLHCAGVAVDVNLTTKTLDWLYDVVGCITAGGRVEIGPTSCTSGEGPVLRMERYGFEAPAAQVPEYLVYILPTSSSTQNCDPAASSPVPVMVAEIWRCVLAENGVSSATAKPVVAQAEVVSLCESSWNAQAIAYGGKYATTPDPITGSTVTNEGVFMLTSSEMAQYGISGSSGTDAVANITAAAQLWSATKSFVAFGCATGHGGFGSGPVLPQYGGPPVPDWAYTY